MLARTVSLMGAAEHDDDDISEKVILRVAGLEKNPARLVCLCGEILASDGEYNDEPSDLPRELLPLPEDKDEDP